jgi:hypothetical protein
MRPGRRCIEGDESRATRDKCSSPAARRVLENPVETGPWPGILRPRLLEKLSGEQPALDRQGAGSNPASRSMSDEDPKMRLNLRYPLAQLAKALAGAGEQAATRVKQWYQVLAGIDEGSLDVGSRTPVSDAPAWVSLDVVHGGFATGNFVAGGPLQAHEIEKIGVIDRPADATDRGALNLHYVSESGRAELTAMLHNGLYRVHVPEEAALLVLTWLVRHRESARADRLAEAILPFFARLRFYPVPHPRPLRSGPAVHLGTVGDSLASIRAQRRHHRTERMKEAIEIWAPLYDRTVALFLETVEGEIPRLRTTEAGELARQGNGGPIVEGGWPCRRFPSDWAGRGQELLDSYQTAWAAHGLCGKPERRKENFARLRGYLARCIEKAPPLTRGDESAIRQILASYVTRHGGPGSDRLRSVRTDQARNAARPSHRDLATILASRLEPYATDEGTPDLRSHLVSLSPDEASRIGASAGAPLPPSLVEKAMRCLEAPLEALVAEQVLRSAESMATVVPLLTARVRSSAIADPELRTLYESVYTAFRRRRSLLLLDLQSQTKLSELPWIEAIAPWTGGDEETRRTVRETMTKVTALALQAFPQNIVPNKLVKELRALATSAGEPIPLVEELAADIFMGTFSETFLRAAQAAARVLRGSLYERYYDLPFDQVLDFAVEKHPSGASTSPQLSALCEELVEEPNLEKWSVARNGRIIEQCQILTTHNLAALFEGLALSAPLGPHLPQMARRCFEWTCARQQLPVKDWQPQMQMVKNTAYAWRQMVFFVSLMDGTGIAAFLDWMARHFAAQRQAFRSRFSPVVAGFQAVAAGHRFGHDGLHAASGGRRFLGWSEGRHWVLGDRTARLH